ncbi:uncharacterized protein LOC120559387 isoform X2 [Scomber scombrus]|uniref:Uncharacterized protein LOC120559387 isoform X2 n=1 Tax=Scomber scombrus TaxID=13677 RepID=A0AAV1P684_SCOSC
MVDRDRVNEAIGLLNNILTGSNVIATISEISNRNQQPSRSAVDEEMRRAFRPGASGVSGQSGSSQANLNGNQANQPRFQTQQYLGGWASSRSRRSVELLMACGTKLVSPKLREGQELNGFMIHKVFKSKALYIRPGRDLPFQFDSTDSDDCVEINTSTASNNFQAGGYMCTRSKGNQISTQPPATPHASSDTTSTATLLSAPQAWSDIATEAEPPEEPSACGGSGNGVATSACGVAGRTDHYAAYLSIMGSTSDLSSDEEDLNQAIMASLESHAYVATFY